MGKITEKLRKLGLKVNGTTPTGETISETIDSIADDYEGGSGGTTVVANPTLAGTEDSLTGLQVGENTYKVETPHLYVLTFEIGTYTEVFSILTSKSCNLPSGTKIADVDNTNTGSVTSVLTATQKLDLVEAIKSAVRTQNLTYVDNIYIPMIFQNAFSQTNNYIEINGNTIDISLDGQSFYIYINATTGDFTQNSYDTLNNEIRITEKQIF